MKALALLLIAAGAVGCAFEAPLPDEGLPEVSFSLDRSLVDETVGTTELQLKLSRKTGEAVTVTYNAIGGDGNVAEAPTDFTFPVSSREVTIPAGETRATIPVNILNDGMEELEEHVEIELTLVQHAVLGATRRHTLRISDKLLPRARFSVAASSALEGGAAQNFVIELNSQPETDVVLRQTLTAGTTEPADHGVVDGVTITIPRGQLATQIPAQIANDPTDEDDETFDVTLSGLEGVVVITDGSRHAHTITDDDAPPQIRFALATSATSEAAAAQLAVTLALASEKDISVDYVVVGGTAGLNDFTLASGTLQFPAGTTAKTIDIAVNNDELDELDETVVVELSNAVNATLGTAQHALTITDNDDAPTISFAQATSTVSEGAGTSQVVVVLSAPSSFPIEFSLLRGGSASLNDLTLPPLPVTIPAGATSATIVSTVNDDPANEFDETVTLTLTDVEQATAMGTTTHTITIDDND